MHAPHWRAAAPPPPAGGGPPAPAPRVLPPPAPGGDSEAPGPPPPAPPRRGPPRRIPEIGAHQERFAVHAFGLDDHEVVVAVAIEIAEEQSERVPARAVRFGDEERCAARLGAVGAQAEEAQLLIFEEGELVAAD